MGTLTHIWEERSRSTDRPELLSVVVSQNSISDCSVPALFEPRLRVPFLELVSSLPRQERLLSGERRWGGWRGN